MERRKEMVINTKFDVGDKVFFYEDARVQSGVIDFMKLEISRYGTTWIYDFADGYRMVNPALFESEKELKLKLGLT